MPEAPTAALFVLAVLLAAMIGMHDASNAVSTSIVTRTLRERTALGYAAALNLLGALIGLGMASLTLPAALRLLRLHEVIELTAGHRDVLVLVLVGAVIAALAWDLITWWAGMPSSTWHAVTGAIGGAAIALGHIGPWLHGLTGVLVPVVLSPVVGAVLAFVLIHLVSRLPLTERVRTRHLRFAQTITAGTVAVGHGLRDIMIPAALVVVAVDVRDVTSTLRHEGALLTACVLAMALGTLAGGRRIIRTIGRRLTDLSTAQGLAAEGATALVVGLTSVAPNAPVSTSQTLTSAVVGAGVVSGRRTVRWGVFARILATWLLTPVAAGVLGLATTRLLLLL